jgi:hypothetical protein
MYVCVSVCVHACECVRACVRVCVRACVRLGACMSACSCMYVSLADPLSLLHVQPPPAVKELAELLAPSYALTVSELRKRWIVEAQVRKRSHIL